MKYCIENWKQDIADAEKIVVGIGREFQTCAPGAAKEAYGALGTLLNGRDYFVVSINTDDMIYRSGLDNHRIVCPCGSLDRLQCPDNCNDRIYSVKEAGAEPVCPDCGKPLVANTVDAACYIERAYLEQWRAYTGWLQNTLHHKLVLLELGVGMDFPGVIHFPFEKMCLYNKQAILYRVNHSFSMIPEELVEKAYDIHENAVTFCRNAFVI